MRIPLYIFTKPSNISMAAVALGFAAWAFPSFGVLRKGFDKAAALDPVAILVLVAWYTVIFLSFRIGEFFGTPRHTAPANPSAVDSMDASLPYYIFTIIAAVGVLAAVVKIVGSLSLEGAIGVVLSGEANAMKDAMYEDYKIGLLSLRYITVYPAAIALYRLATRRRFSLSIVVNLLLLLVGVLISARLLLIATLVTTLLMLNYNVRYRTVRLSRVLIVAALLFSVLSVFNYSRNYGFYEDRGLGFWGSGFAEIITYLGCTSQVQLGTAARTADLVSGKEETYRDLVDIELQINAVSPFVMLHQSMGYFCWLYIAIVCGVAGFVFTWLVGKGATMYLLPCGAILYGSSELWRLNFFGQGIFITLMIVGIGVPWFISVLSLAAAPKQITA